MRMTLYLGHQMSRRLAENSRCSAATAAVRGEQNSLSSSHTERMRKTEKWDFQGREAFQTWRIKLPSFKNVEKRKEQGIW